MKIFVNTKAFELFYLHFVKDVSELQFLVSSNLRLESDVKNELRTLLFYTEGIYTYVYIASRGIELLGNSDLYIT